MCILLWGRVFCRCRLDQRTELASVRRWGGKITFPLGPTETVPERGAVFPLSFGCRGTGAGTPRRVPPVSRYLSSLPRLSTFQEIRGES